MGWDRAFPLIILIIAVASAYYGTIKSRSCSSNYHLHSDSPWGSLSHISSGLADPQLSIQVYVSEWVSDRSGPLKKCRSIYTHLLWLSSILFRPHYHYYYASNLISNANLCACSWKIPFQQDLHPIIELWTLHSTMCLREKNPDSAIEIAPQSNWE